jgi:hypothetical protein
MTQTKQPTNAISEQKVSLENRLLKDDELEAVSGGVAAEDKKQADQIKAFQQMLQEI